MSIGSDGITFSSVLVVDDDPIMREVARSALRVAGIDEVGVATSGLDALARLQDNEATFDLIVSDLQMPEMDGMSFFRSLSERGYAGALIVLSSMDDDVLQLSKRLADAHGLNILGVLSKPLVVPRLKELLVALDRAHSPVESRPIGSSEPGLLELRDAIHSKQIRPYYQYKVDIATGLVTGVEALARWYHPAGRILLPGNFIEPLERHGLIGDLSWSVTAAALADARQLTKRLPKLKVSVNFSADQICDRELPERLKGLLDISGVAPENLQIEVTEHKLLELSVDAMEVFGRLRLLGVGLSIDDFGTGQANLATLRDFPFSELKIDRSFIATAPRDARAREALAACVNMGKNLGMRIVAEGVETEEQLQLVSRLGADEVQGFIFSRPAPVDELMATLPLNAIPVARYLLDVAG